MGKDGSAKSGGRPATFDTDDIIAAGRELGMSKLSLSAVAARLGVTPAALYRHVDGRWGLEQLVGEDLLSELTLVDDPDADIETHLIEFGTRLRRFILDHPGLVAYLQTVFPRGTSGGALLVAEVEILERRGYDTPAALVLSNAVALLAIALAADQDRRSSQNDPKGWARQAAIAEQIVAAHPALGAGFALLPQMTEETVARLLLTASISGLLAVVPPGRPIEEGLEELALRGGLDLQEVR